MHSATPRPPRPFTSFQTGDPYSPEIAVPGDAVLKPLHHQERIVGYLGLLPRKQLSDEHQVRFLKEQKFALALVAGMVVLVAAGFSLLLAQRLVRTICPKCKEEVAQPQRFFDGLGVSLPSTGPLRCIMPPISSPSRTTAWWKSACRSSFRTRSKISVQFGRPIHPGWRRCSSSQYVEYSSSSRLASRAPRRPEFTNLCSRGS